MRSRQLGAKPAGWYLQLPMKIIQGGTHFSRPKSDQPPRKTVTANAEAPIA